ncbi:MAG: diguanylate cyclase, partial [Blautia sp.]|nr:diguanylate cyclase [Blautia sp.]
YNKELYTDALTGTYNRRYYEDRLKKTKETAGVAMIDLDDFKMYNDTYGHRAGDKVLDAVVKVIRKCIRKSDILVRYGGDEFLLILQDIGEADFVQKLHTIREEIHQTRIQEYEKIRPSVSIGGVRMEGETLEEAVNRADHFMYQAKIQKNMVVTEERKLQDPGEEKAEKPQNPKKSKSHRIMIVDDSEMNRFLLREMLGQELEILEVENGEECLEQLQRYGTDISLVLLDIVMPLKSGFEVLEEMDKNHWLGEIPVIMISSEDSAAAIRRAYELGVTDYISRPFDAQVVYRRVMNTIKLYTRQRHLVDLVKDQLYEKEKNNRMMIAILSKIVEFRSGESGSHVLHINMLTEWLLEELVHRTDQYSLSWTDRLLICTASSLHDIGKIGIPESILNKRGKLTTEELEEMKKHTLIGASILKNLGRYQKEPLLETAYQICRWHHERYDGKGYPDGLKGEEIPIAAQIVSLANAYDALVSDRGYRKVYSHDTALKMILDGECGSFNPLLLECLRRIHTKIRQEYEKAALGRKEDSFLKDDGKTKELFFQTIAKESEDF